MEIETTKQQTTHVFHADEVYSSASEEAPRGMVIRGTDTDGVGFRLEIDLPMLNDILGGVLEHVRLDGRPTARVFWNAKEDVVELRSDPTATSEGAKKDPVI